MIKSEDISVIIQGAIDRELTQKCLKSIRKKFPNAKIILSTWEESNVENLDYDTLLLNTDPSGFKDKNVNFTNNLLRQLVSTQNALKVVDTKYTIKMRTDIIFENNNFLKFWNKFSKRDDNYNIYKHKIISSSFFFKRFLCDKKGLSVMPVPFHISDWFQFGLSEDIKKLYNIELPKEPEQAEFLFNNPYKGFNVNLLQASHQYAPEQYIAYNSYKKHIKHTPVSFQNYMDFNSNNIEESEKFIINNFIILSPKEIGFMCLKEQTNNDKYKIWCKNPLSVPYLLWNGLYRPYVYRILYKKHCDKRYNMPIKIRLSETIEKIIIARGRKCIVR